MEPHEKVADQLDWLKGRGKYCRNPHGDVLQFPELPEGTKVLFYNHYLPGIDGGPWKPSITVALLFDPNNLRRIARGISVCSPEENAIKKEGRIRAVGRALRSWNREQTGPMFIHPRAHAVIKAADIPEANMHVFSADTAFKCAWQPPITRFEEELLSNYILSMTLRRGEVGEDDQN